MGPDKTNLRLILSIVIIIAFFLPWFKADPVGFSILFLSAFQLVKNFFEVMPEIQSESIPAESWVMIISIMLIPVSALMILIGAINKRR